MKGASHQPHIGQELLDGARAIQHGKGRRAVLNLLKDVRAIRMKIPKSIGT